MTIYRSIERTSREPSEPAKSRHSRHSIIKGPSKPRRSSESIAARDRRLERMAVGESLPPYSAANFSRHSSGRQHATAPPPSSEDFARYQRERSHSARPGSRSVSRLPESRIGQRYRGLQTISEEPEYLDHKRTTSYMTGRGFDSGRIGMFGSTTGESSPLGLFGRLPVELVQQIVDLLKKDIHMGLPTINVQAIHKIVQRPTSLSNGRSLFGPSSTIAAASKALRDEVTTYIFGSTYPRHYLKVTSRYTKGNTYNPVRIKIPAFTIPDDVSSLFVYVDVNFMPPGMTNSNSLIRTYWESTGIREILAKALKDAKGLDHLAVRFRLHHTGEGKTREFGYPISERNDSPHPWMPTNIKDACVTYRVMDTEHAYFYGTMVRLFIYRNA